jgi:DNA-directed RNA polymerase specialized sigma24 family protein
MQDESERRRRFDELFAAYSADIVAYCSWRAASTSDAQDAVADVFLTAWRRLDDLPEGDAARVWLYSAARKVIANQRRARRRRAALHDRLNARGAADPRALARRPRPRARARGAPAARPARPRGALAVGVGRAHACGDRSRARLPDRHRLRASAPSQAAVPRRIRGAAGARRRRTAAARRARASTRPFSPSP